MGLFLGFDRRLWVRGTVEGKLLKTRKNNKSMDISVVIPLYNEEESLPELQAWIQRVMKANGFSYEIIFINDGSKDNTIGELKKLVDAKCADITVVDFSRNFGKEAGLRCLVERCRPSGRQVSRCAR
mgnify:CR=1 FL=1